MTRKRWRRDLVVAGTALTGAAACYGEGSGLTARQRLDAGPMTSIVDAGLEDAGSDADAGPGTCSPARSFETVPARTAVMTAQASASSTMFSRDLFNQFKSSCGGCHVEQALGGFHVSPVSFSADMNRDDVLTAIFSDDPNKVMPPGVGAASSRNAQSDPYLQLGALLRAWYAQGRPATIFVLPKNGRDGGTDGGTSNLYRLTQSVGTALTNIGNCIPAKESVAVLPDKLDDFFAKATSLPERLDQTDLTTFDSDELAKNGVIAYAPAYPLWSDDARKIRYVRVPRGQSIRFDATGETPVFDIPENTRFYKTFLRKVVEKDGSEHYRKIETRLIVARHDENDPKTAAAVAQKALYGTYAWNEQETEATLVADPLRDLKPFKDRLITYVTDEAKYQKVVSASKDGGSLDLDLERAGAIRHYAIPGSDRCLQCHMGSPSQSFVLGFTPLQINRRPLGVGGIIEKPGDDELTQLERLQQYGIVTGIENAADVPLLEKSEGARAPRNDYELTAQAYMLGNCAHCHNERGYPSIQNPSIAHLVDFLPGPGESDGIFQFPLERFSPRIKRDIGGSVEIPYITPSLVDYPGQGDFNHTVDHSSPSPDPQPASGMVLAPWRSLIYRNVDTPFPYSVDLALFPHMPMNAPGFDCRLPRIMGDWMVSIPAVRKHPEIDETMVQGGIRGTGNLYDNAGTDNEPQPYIEVPSPDANKPNLAKQQSDYKAAQQAANDRLAAYHSAGAKGLSETKNDWSRYGYCPDTSDIVDPTVTGADRAHLVPSDLEVFKLGDQTFNVPVDYQPFQSSGLYTEDLKHVPSTATLAWPDEGVPDRPHWVVTDTTDNPPPWVPRRDDWSKVLKDHQYSSNDGADEQRVVEMLSPSAGGAGVRITQSVHDFATTEIAYGLWQKKDTCSKLSQFETVSDYQGADRPLWMDVASAKPDDIVYSELPGAAVFNMVCINCHGPQADSHGRQADTLQLMTGGDARVANLRDGLFGPTTSPGANRKRVYDVTPGAGNPTADDWAARYLAWMALGGTQKLIPRAILNVVASTPILGVPRSLPGVDSANMLGPVQTLCGEFFGISGWPPRTPDLDASDFAALYPNTPKPGTAWDTWLWKQVVRAQKGIILDQNGDAELWSKLCGLDNTMPVAVIHISNKAAPPLFAPDDNFQLSYLDAAAYPAGSAVGNDRGGVDTGVQPTNRMPWCIKRPEDPPTDYPPDLVNAYVAAFTTSDGKPLPFCPSDFVTNTVKTYGDLRQWSYRGAINAGLVVFLYLDKVANGYKPIPPYDQCENLP